MQPQSPRKIYQIGFGLTGVLSLNHYFQSNGISTIQWDEGRLARTVEANIQAGRPAFTGYEGYQAFLNMEYMLDNGEVVNVPEKYLGEIFAQDPDGIYLLNVQPVEQLIDIRSRLYGYLPAAMAYYGTDEQGVFCKWREAYDIHLARVAAVFAGTDRLVTFDLAHNSPADLDAIFVRYGFKLSANLWQDIPEARGSVNLTAHVRNIREAALYFRYHLRDLSTAIVLLEAAERYKPCTNFYRNELASWRHSHHTNGAADQKL